MSENDVMNKVQLNPARPLAAGRASLQTHGAQQQGGVVNASATITASASTQGGQSAAAAPPRRRAGSLGKGLGALLGEAADDYKQLDSALAAKGPPAPKSNVPVDLISPGPFQPRKHFDAAALADLAQSIREKGVIQPLVVRRNPADPNRYQIIAGERRWRASQQAGLHEVPVVVRDYTDAQAMEVALIENVQRQDLNPIEEAEGYARLNKEYGHTQDEVARLVGKSRSHVTNMMRLLQLPAEIKEKLKSGDMTAGHGRALLAAAQDPAVIERILKGGSFSGTVREAEQVAREVRAEQGAAPGKKHQGVKLRDPNTMQLEKTISQALGLKVAIMGKGPSGSLMIKYQTLDQLDDLLKKLCGQAVRV